MKFIKKINELFNEKEIEREDDFYTHDEEEGDEFDHEEDFYSHDEEEGDEFDHEEENWGDEEDSSLGGSRISSFDDFGTHDGGFGGDDPEEECEPCGDDEDEDFGYATHDGGFGGDDSEDDEDESFEEEGYVESFKSFNEKKKIPKGLQDYLDKKAGKKESKEDKEDKKDGKKAKPDFLDLDKDGDKKEPMKKAAKEAKNKRK